MQNTYIGIQDTDLMLYVTADDTTSSCGGTTLAHAGPCAYDQYGIYYIYSMTIST